MDGLAVALGAVVVGDLVMDAEPDRLVAPRDGGAPERAAQTLDPRPARVDHFAHGLDLPEAAPLVIDGVDLLLGLVDGRLGIAAPRCLRIHLRNEVRAA